MNGILNSHDADENEDDEWVFVGTAYTNTTPGSVHVVNLDPTPICENMPNKAFRKLIVRLRDAAISLIQDRIHGVAHWEQREQKVLIHECTHYVDTFDSNDEIYGFGTGLKYWARDHRDLAINNADSLACYISFFDDRVLW
ncbi:hypothetical protein GWK53_02130 [Burkholderia cepacia]|uniref:hypothetical protein n=1 Tax=Burkholderia cepacia TaxID=292 RepID=UPI0013F4192C|nr:hypothetical protein [Burkholderia cepacia]NHB05303.1 hypothetical protein [Burkholderia cepacia]